MYFYLLTFHSIIRWIVLILLIYTIIRTGLGWLQKKYFTSIDDFCRHSTATAAHIQLTLGVILFTKSPAVKTFWASPKTTFTLNEFWFFGLFHILMMVAAIIVLTIGSGMAKRKATDIGKFRTAFIWFGVSLLIMLIAIPWPFSPFSQRPYIRLF